MCRLTPRSAEPNQDMSALSTTAVANETKERWVVLSGEPDREYSHVLQLQCFYLIHVIVAQRSFSCEGPNNENTITIS